MTRPSDFQIDVRDLRKLRRALNDADREFGKKLRTANKEAAEVVLKEAIPLVPVRTGKLQRSTKVRASQTSASIKSGSKSRVPYAPPIHWGWKARNIDPSEYLYSAIVKSRQKVLDVYSKSLEKVIKDAGLGRRF